MPITCVFLAKPKQVVRQKIKQQGVGLIEVLISVLIMSIGLLGLVGLQISSVNNATLSYTNTQAIFALQDMAGLLISSAPAAKAGDFDIPPNLNTSLKGFSDLTAPDVGDSQTKKARYYWFQNLNDALPNARASLECDAAGTCIIKVEFSNVDKNSTGTISEQTVMVKV